MLNALRDLSAGQVSLDTDGLTVGPHQLLGIEINPRAAAIAEIVLWIGFIQWHFRINGRLGLPDPILTDLSNIENRDALIDYRSREPMLDESGQQIFTWDRITFKTSPSTNKLIPDEKATMPVFQYIGPSKSAWPEADFIIGNPPFIGASVMKRALGDGYVSAVRSVWKDVPESADFVMYWWHNAAEQIRKGKAQRFGFISTNSITQTFNRRVVEGHLQHKTDPLSLAFAIPDHPWVDSSDGAAVRIAMSVVQKGSFPGTLLEMTEELDAGEIKDVRFSQREGLLYSDFGVGANISSCLELKSNSHLSNKGVLLAGAGFIVTPEESKTLGLGTVDGLERHIVNYKNGRDILQSSRGVMVIDLFGLTKDEVRTQYGPVYQWVFERVKPERDNNKRETRKRNWWLFGETNKKLRMQLNGLSRYIVTVETSKHRVFKFLEKDVLPDNKLVNIAVEDASIFGVLSSRVHTLWALRTGSTLEDRPVYVKTTCFERFPFPDLSDDTKETIANLAESIEVHRNTQQANYPSLSLTNMYNVLEKLRSQTPLTVKELEVNQQGLVSILGELHDRLDKAVFNAYGWEDVGNILIGMPGATTSLKNKASEQLEAEEQLLIRLVNLNATRAAEEAQDEIKWLRPEYQSVDTKSSETMQVVENHTVEAEKEGLSGKMSWPREMRDQVNTLIELLETPMPEDRLASKFKRNPIKHVRAVLYALEALGKAQLEDGVWLLT